MKIILVIDSFKGCLSSSEVEEMAAQGVKDACNEAEIISFPVSDGGEGMVNAFAKVLNADLECVRVHNSMMQFVDAKFAIKDNTAIIEVAQAIGLYMIPEKQRNPLVATSYGVGELLIAAYNRGARKFIVGLGGTATSDCGLGMLKALKESKMMDKLKSCQFIIASDVNNILLGKDGAAEVFAPQKGADTKQIIYIERRALTFSEMCAKHFGYDCSQNAGAGAAGGLGYSFMQFFNAKMKSGADLLLDTLNFNNQLSNADLVITGEGCADGQTLMGKIPCVIMNRVKQYGIPVFLIAGKVLEKDKLINAGFSKVISINPSDITLEEAMQPDVARKNIRSTVNGLINEIR